MRNVRKLDFAERWFRDGLAVCRPPSFSESLEVDATRAGQLIEIARARGIRLTYTHLLVRATALALAANPDSHILVCGSKAHSPAQVDIALSISGETFLTPTLVIEAADRKDLHAIANEIVRRTPEIREQDRKMLRLLRRWGWLLPIGVLRRGLLRFLNRFFAFRRKGSGTFQVSVVSGVDNASTSLFNTSAILTAGRVRDRVVAVAGLPVVRPTINLTCSADHRVWNGSACQKFLLAVSEILETGSLDRELSVETPGEGNYTSIPSAQLSVPPIPLPPKF